MNDINPYQEDEFRKKFIQTDLYSILEKDFDEIIWSRYEIFDYGGGTPRQNLGDKTLWKARFSVVPFYYLEFLTKQNPKNIYDLGCGWNIFKKYIPSIIGMGEEDPDSKWFFGDIHGRVDDNFITEHQNYFDSVFSICALHFTPMSNIRQRVLEFASMIKPSGRGWISLNAKRMLELDSTMFAQNNIELWVRSELSNLPFNILQFDIDLKKVNSPLDGNINLVLEK